MVTIIENLDQHPEQVTNGPGVKVKTILPLDPVTGNFVQPIIPYNHYFNIFDFVY